MSILSAAKLGERSERVLNELAPELLTPGTLDSFTTWLRLIVDWNQRVDLTAARNEDELVDLCLADAAVIARHSRDAKTRTWVDVGTGLGAPGLALAVLAPDREMTLVEPKTKRVAFLRTACGALRLPNVRVERARSEDLGPRGFDVAISRATLPPDAWLCEGARLSQELVWVLLAKGEMPALAGWEVAAEIPYRWPLTDVNRRAVAFRAQKK